MAKITLRMEPYDPDAKDADGDGIVQERTPWERPVGARLLDKFGNEIAKGAIENARPDGMQVIDKDGNKIDYVPSYAGRVPSNPSEGPKSALSDHGALSIRERGFPNIEQNIAMAMQRLEDAMNRAARGGQAPQRSDDTLVDELVAEIGDDLVAGNRTDDVGLRRLRKFLGTATEKINESFPDASDEDVKSLLKHAALAYMWREEVGNRDSKFNFKEFLDEIFDGEEGLVEPHDLLDSLYEAGGLRLVSTAVLALKDQKLDNSAFAKLAKRLQQRFDGFELEAGELDDATGTWGDAGRIGAIEQVLEAWDATKQTAGDPESLDDIDDILARKFKALEPLSAEEIERVLERPDIDERVDWTLLEGEVIIAEGENEVIHYPRAERHLHDDNGDIEDIPPQALITAILDGGIRLPNGRRIDFMDVLFEPELYDNVLQELEVMSNGRFDIMLIKNTGEISPDIPIWAVFEVTDKKTGKRYFLKTSQYGVHDSLLERVGDDTQALFGFVTPTGRRFVNLQEQGNLVSGDAGGMYPSKPIRWSLTPHVADLMQPRTTPDSLQEVRFMNRLLADAGISEEEAVQDPELIDQIARLTLMDFLLGNSDRHGSNLMAYVDSRGKVRLVPIDHGLMFGGRLREDGIDPDLEWDETDWAQFAEAEGLTTIYGWRVDGNFSKMWNIFGDLRFRQLPDADTDAVVNPAPPDKRPAWGLDNERRMIQIALEMAQRLDDDTIARLFSPDRLEEQGVGLSDSERQHLEAMETMFRLRLEQVIDDPDEMFVLFPR